MTTVREIRRYPVKSMGGESLASAQVDSRGLLGDRSYAVVDRAGRLSSGKSSRRFRRRDAVFDFRATTRDSAVTVSRLDGDGDWSVGDPALDRTLTEAMGDPVRVLAERDVPHHDASPVSLIGTATLAWCVEHLEVDADPRRLRMNVLVETAVPFEEEQWVGRRLSLGTTVLEVAERTVRCRMIDIAQDGIATTTDWLKRLDGRDLCLGVYADVGQPGAFAVGDAVVVGDVKDSGA